MLIVTDEEFLSASELYGPSVAHLLKRIEQVQQGIWHFRIDSQEALSWRVPEDLKPKTKPKISAVFLDRDGVLNPHIPGGYLLAAGDVRLLPGVAHAVRRLNDANLPVIVISNQQGVGKALMTLDDLTAIERRMEALLDEEAGAKITRCYYSTELQSVNSPRRKPAPGMLLEAASDFNLRLNEAVFLGDSPTDIQAGKAAGVGATVLLLSGGSRSADGMIPAPDFVFAGLPAAVSWILENCIA